jgi:hypothetical protein
MVKVLSSRSLALRYPTYGLVVASMLAENSRQALRIAAPSHTVTQGKLPPEPAAASGLSETFPLLPGATHSS